MTIVAILIIAFLSFIILFLFSPSRIKRIHGTERQFLNQVSGKLEEFPYCSLQPEVEISVIVPAYNEEQRLPVMLQETLAHLVKKFKSFEVIIVDDGSQDGTSELAMKIGKKAKQIRVLRLQRNRGKGGAVMQGIMASRGQYVLFADADGATCFSDLDLLMESCKTVEADGLAFVAGSRAHMVSSEAVVKVCPPFHP